MGGSLINLIYTLGSFGAFQSYQFRAMNLIGLCKDDVMPIKHHQPLVTYSQPKMEACRLQMILSKIVIKFCFTIIVFLANNQSATSFGEIVQYVA